MSDKGPDTGSRTATDDAGRVPRRAKAAFLISSIGIFLALLVAAALNNSGVIRHPITLYQFWHQDLVISLFIGAFLFALANIKYFNFFSSFGVISRSHRRLLLFSACLFVTISSAIAANIGSIGFHLSRDEVLAVFDAAIFRSGHLMADVTPEWRAFVPALAGVPGFLLPVPSGAAWVSSYLPVNAMMRAVWALIGDPVYMNPALAGMSVWALAGIGQRLWPTHNGATLVAATLLATSSQAILSAATSYSMTAHLAANLLWLRLFLRDDRLGHLGCIGVSALACGLHQIIFHPLFVSPFIYRLFAQGRLGLASIYTLSYFMIFLFWISVWPALQMQSVSDSNLNSAVFGIGFFLGKVFMLISRFSAEGIALMLDNIIRFVSWQNVILLPLMISSLPAWRRRDGIIRELSAGIVITLAAMLVILPWQGHGWGYRYLHGFLGSACLIAAYGWIEIGRHASRLARLSMMRLFMVATGVSATILLPAHMLAVNRQSLPYQSAIEMIQRTNFDVVFVDVRNILHGDDLIRNDPYLTNSPKMIDLRYVSNSQITDICNKYSTAVFDSIAASAYPFPSFSENSEYLSAAVRALIEERRALMAQIGCAAGSLFRDSVARSSRGYGDAIPEPGS